MKVGVALTVLVLAAGVLLVDAARQRLGAALVTRRRETIKERKDARGCTTDNWADQEGRQRFAYSGWEDLNGKLFDCAGARGRPDRSGRRGGAVLPPIRGHRQRPEAVRRRHGNRRILSVKLGYHPDQRIALKDVPDQAGKR